MLARLSTAIAAICMLSGAALAQAAAKLTDPQIAHIAYRSQDLPGASAARRRSRRCAEVRSFSCCRDGISSSLWSWYGA
jgi:predicted outer membrane protein